MNTAATIQNLDLVGSLPYTNSGALTIEGAGSLGNSTISGTMTLNSTTAGTATLGLKFLTSSGTLNNSGTIALSNSGNTGIANTAIAQVVVNVGSLNSGTISLNTTPATASGIERTVLQVNGNGSFTNSGAVSLNVSAAATGGTLESRFVLNGQVTLNNTGTINIQNTGFANNAADTSLLTLADNATITGTGTITLGANAGIRRSTTSVLTPLLTLDGGTVKLQNGHIGEGNMDLSIASGGTLLVHAGGGTSTINTNGVVLNAGTVQVDFGNTLTLTKGLSNSGTVGVAGTVHLASYAQSAGTLTLSGTLASSGTYTQSGGALTLNGGTASATSFDISGGTVGGSGALTGDVTLSGGVLTVAGADTLFVNGGLAQSAVTTLTVDGELTANTLAVNRGTLTGSGTVNALTTIGDGANAATVSGNLTIAGLTLSSTGNLSPGNSIGTITVSGNYADAAASNIFMDVDATTATGDFVNVSGTANLHGLLTVAMTGTPPTFETIQLLFATGGITGQWTWTNPINEWVLVTTANAVSLSFVPEPVPTILIGFGLVGIAALYRRRHRQS